MISCYRPFYSIKSIIPRSMQIHLRRFIVKRVQRKCKGKWPILIGSEKIPDKWNGWPGGKEFALVITHDVEKKKGYERVLNLMEMEKELSFVSSFNFVPERDYIVEKKLLETLKANGFEVGVHGLHHDGKLFSSEQEFLNRAKKINQYLKDWNTVGFRAPAMHHNLDWIGELDIEYDLSTFDTDPFEPQSDGIGTIFPFWVERKRKKNSGYVELPYTLPQDFTLFVLMKEQSPHIWIDKLDWIAENGGMALVNVHPDYLNFENKYSIEEFPVRLYIEFLDYVKSNYQGKFWQALPKQVTKFIKTLRQDTITLNKRNNTRF